MAQTNMTRMYAEFVIPHFDKAVRVQFPHPDDGSFCECGEKHNADDWSMAILQGLITSLFVNYGVLLREPTGRCVRIVDTQTGQVWGNAIPR